MSTLAGIGFQDPILYQVVGLAVFDLILVGYCIANFPALLAGSNSPRKVRVPKDIESAEETKITENPPRSSFELPKGAKVFIIGAAIASIPATFVYSLFSRPSVSQEIKVDGKKLSKIDGVDVSDQEKLAQSVLKKLSAEGTQSIELTVIENGAPVVKKVDFQGVDAQALPLPKPKAKGNP